MSYREDEYLQLSGLQHFIFCRRQWALIHIENVWKENLRTVEGNIMHERAHDNSLRERRNGIITVRSVSISSSTLGISGQCDVLEFHEDSTGVILSGHEGTWRPFPVEYKRGSPKEHSADRLQLCAQAMCLEEMLCCEITEGALFYGETRRREMVIFSEEMRSEVVVNLEEMHRMFQRGWTPKARQTKSCNACSLKELCMPKIMKGKSVKEYLLKAMEES